MKVSDAMSPIVSPRVSLDAARDTIESARQQINVLSDGILEGFDDLSASITCAGRYIGLGCKIPQLDIVSVCRLVTLSNYNLYFFFFCP